MSETNAEDSFICVTTELKMAALARLKRDVLRPEYWLGLGVKPDSDLARRLACFVSCTPDWCVSCRLLLALEKNDWQVV